MALTATRLPRGSPMAFCCNMPRKQFDEPTHGAANHNTRPETHGLFQSTDDDDTTGQIHRGTWDRREQEHKDANAKEHKKHHPNFLRFQIGNQPRQENHRAFTYADGDYEVGKRNPGGVDDSRCWRIEKPLQNRAAFVRDQTIFFVFRNLLVQYFRSKA